MAGEPCCTTDARALSCLLLRVGAAVTGVPCFLSLLCPTLCFGRTVSDVLLSFFLLYKSCKLTPVPFISDNSITTRPSWVFIRRRLCKPGVSALCGLPRGAARAGVKRTVSAVASCPALSQKQQHMPKLSLASCGCCRFNMQLGQCMFLVCCGCIVCFASS